MTAEELAQDILKYKSFMQVSNGGFTASGGEPLLQAEFITELFKWLSSLGIHTAIDTSGYTAGDNAHIAELLDYTDLVLLDIKSIIPDKYKQITGVDLTPTLEFAKLLQEKQIPVWIRYVIVPSLTDSYEDAEQLAQYLTQFTNIEKVELLPFHKMGEEKWEELKLPYKLKDTPIPSEQLMKDLKDIFSNNIMEVI